MKIDLEYLKKQLNEKELLKNKVISVIQQLTGQIELLKEMIETCEKEEKQPSS